jgi:hypothetical protein
MAKFTPIITRLEKQRKELKSRLSRLDEAIKALATMSGPGGWRGGKRQLSTAARNRIAAAQRVRWAKWKRAKKAA